MFIQLGLKLGDYCKTYFIGIGLGYQEKIELQSIANLGGSAAELYHCNDVQLSDIFDRIKINIGIQRRVAIISDGINYLAAKQNKLHLTAKREKFLVLFDIDMSGSMDGIKWKRVKQAVSAFFNELDESDIIGIVLFNNEAKCITEKNSY